LNPGRSISDASGETFKFFAQSDEEGSFEVEFNEDMILVYGWSGSTVKVFCDREELRAGDGERPIVPAIPDGHTVSSFMGFMFNSKK